MKKIVLIIVILLSFSFNTECYSQIKITKFKTVRIYGSCFMCKAQIEAAGNHDNVSKVEWNLHTQIATISYDARKTSLNKILKKIALAGFDNERYLAPDTVYEKLEDCCHYEREAKHKYECKICKRTYIKSGKCSICNMEITKKAIRKGPAPKQL